MVKEEKERLGKKTFYAMRTIRIDEEMLHKLHIVADYEDRSANSEI